MNKKLLVLSGISILAVVLNHASHQGFIALFWWTDRYWDVAVPNYDQMGSWQYYALVAQQKLAVFCVPAFLFVSGVFLAYVGRGSQARITWTVVWRRVLNLLPPYLIWTVVFYIAQLLLGNVHTPVEYFLGLVWVDYAPFFFVPLIAVYYLLSPLLAPLAMKRWKLLLAIAVVILLGGVLRTYAYLLIRLGVQKDLLEQVAPFLPGSRFFEYFVYYALGLVYGFWQAQIKPVLIRYRWVLFGLMIVSGIGAVVEAEWAFQAADLSNWRTVTLTIPTVLFSIACVACFLGFDQVNLPFSNLFYRLGVDTLGIYIIHQLVLLFMPKIIYHVLPFILQFEFIYQPVLVVTAIGIPLLMMNFTRRTPLRRYYRLIFG